MNLVWLLRAKRWLQHPPSKRQLITVAVVVALCLGLAGAEWLGLWPDSWHTQGGSRLTLPRP